MVRYKTFREMILAVAGREGNAFQYPAEDGSVRNLSCAEFAETVMKRADEKRKLGKGTDIIYAVPSADAIADIFASAIAGRCVLMANPTMPDKVLVEAKEGTDRLVCSKMREDEEGELLFFTSGTTNRSKVVRLTTQAVCSSVWNGQSMLACGPEDRILCLLPLSHVYGLVCGMLWGLAYGAVICLCPDQSKRLEMPGLLRPTILPAVPAIIDAMLDADALNPELRTVLIGAAPCSDYTLCRLEDRGIDVYIGYGLTETSSGIAITQGRDDLESMYLCPDTEIRIEADGEIAVRTTCMMKGYLSQPETTEDHWLYTGDLGWLDDQGRIHLQGRKNNVLILSDGTKINCPEYEHDIADMSGEPDVALVDRNGELVLVAGSDADTDSLWEVVREYNKTMMKSQQIDDIEVFGRPLPRTITGKLRRYELQKKYYQ